MGIIADLHIHSRFSRACSKDLNIKNLEKWARIKGINLLGTGDFTHPEWLKELKSELSEDETGILRTKTGFPFLLQVEISQIYTQEKGRRIHNIIWAPNFDIVDQINAYFATHGRMDYDGRPIFKIPCPDLMEAMRSISKDIEVIPAHAWTPWFSIFGSKSGFDSVEEAFGDQAKHIHAIETGISSDPPLNRMISGLDKYNLVSFSDAHSFWPWRLGREATIFDTDMKYDDIIQAVRTGEKIAETIEVDPSYGKYHVDGHRACDIVMEPEESKKHENICPKCKRPLTLGVLHRIKDLTDRKESQNVPKYRSLLPLTEIISNMIGAGLATQKSWKIYWSLLEKFGNEYKVLLEAPEAEIAEVVGKDMAAAIIQNRNGNIEVIPGYDGVYGIPQLKKIEVNGKQKGLGDFV